MTPTQKAISKKLSDPARRSKYETALYSTEPLWVWGILESRTDIEEALREQGDRP